jgi:pyruvate/2-oxoglutarate dehydrogenase complex dihydrolipoamide dehydrogenase (E3) component
MHWDYEFLVIGGGSAGYNAAAQAVRLGMRTAVVDGAEELGGLCILRGCMPSKTFLESSNRSRAIRHAAEFGLSAALHAASGEQIQSRKSRLIGEFADYRRGQLEAGKFALLRGHARFKDPHTVEISDASGKSATVTAGAVLVATGSVVSHPDIPGLTEQNCWDSDAVLASREIPPSVIILGGGAIALEFASHYEGLGSRVTLIQRSRQVLSFMDEDVAVAVQSAMSRRGVEVITSTELQRIESAPSGEKRVHFTRQGASCVAQAAQIVCAMGRKPNIDGLNAESAGIRIERGRIQTDQWQRCGADHLFAAGDVCGPHEVVHIAIQQGELAARNAAASRGGGGARLEAIDYRLKLFAAFCHPEVAAVGLSEREAAAAGSEVAVASYPFADHGKSIVMGETDGFVKLLVDKASRRIVGAAVVGPHASEHIHEVVVAMRFHATAGDLAATPHYHPTLSEIWTYPAEELA